MSTQSQNSSPAFGCLNIGGELYKAISLMSQFQNEIMKLMNNFKIQLAQMFGNKNGLIERFLQIAFASAKDAGNAMRKEAQGYLVAGGLALGAAGVALGVTALNA